MASIIRIKRSSTSGNPSTLGAGELAYSALADNGANGGDRLYIGMGTETSGNAVNHVIIGGKYYTGLVDAGGSGGTLNTTAKSVPVLSATGTIDKWLVGNLQLTSSTLSSTNTNGDINITPNGTGKVVLTNPYIGDTATTLLEYIYDAVGGTITAGTGITSTVNDAGNTTTLSIASTGVTAGSYGSATSIPTFTVNAQGQLTVAGSATISTTLSIAGNTGTAAVALGTDTLTFTGSTGITTVASKNLTADTLTIGIDTSVVATLTGTQTLTNKTINLGSNTLVATSAQLAAAVTDETGSGSLVFATSPTLVTPILGVATATSINKVAITAPATGSTLTIADGKTLTASNTLTFTGSDSSSVNFGSGGTVAYTGSGLNQFAATTSAQLAGVISDETGSGSLVFATSPTLVTPTIGAATATSITGSSGNLTITAAAGNNNINLVATGTGTIDHGGARLTSVGTPTQTTDAATKGYVDSIKQALDIKDSVRVATTGNLTATASGTGAGKTLTNSGTQAAITIDSIVLSAGDRVLVKDQSTAANNGIYTVTTVGSASTNWVLTRATDADNSTSGEVTPGMFAFVEEGTVNADSGWVLTTDGAVTLDTTALNFVQFSGAGQIIAGNGLTKTGNQIDVVGTANRIIANADSIDIASTYVGQASITTLGTIGTGVWQGTIVGPTYGGTGVNNGSNTLTLAGSVTHAGAFTQTFTATANTSITLPTTGTLATLAGSETLTNKTLTAPVIATIVNTGTLTLPTSTDTLVGRATTDTLTNKTLSGAVISGGSINNTPIGATTASTGAFTTLSASGTITASGNITGAGAATSTLDGFNIDGGTY